MPDLVSSLPRDEAERLAGFPAGFDPRAASRAECVRLLVAMFPAVHTGLFQVERVPLDVLRSCAEAGTLPPRIAVLAGLAADPRDESIRDGLGSLAQAVDALAAKVERIGGRRDLQPAGASSSFVPDPTLASLAPVWIAQAAAGQRVVVGLVGPAGYGKSSAARWIADTAGLPFVKVDASTNIEASDWWGSVGLAGGDSSFKDGRLAEAVAAPGVVLIDEANRCHPTVSNGLLSALDDQREVDVPGRPEPIRIAPGVLFVLSLNIGSEYTGTEAMDAALASRVTGWGMLGAPADADVEVGIVVSRFPDIDEDEAGDLVRFCRLVRETAASRPEWEVGEAGVSTRAVLAAAGAVAVGAPVRLAVESSIVLSYSSATFGDRPSPRDRVRRLADEFEWVTA
jgi:hypothetical protein